MMTKLCAYDNSDSSCLCNDRCAAWKKEISNHGTKEDLFKRTLISCGRGKFVISSKLEVIKCSSQK